MTEDNKKVYMEFLDDIVVITECIGYDVKFCKKHTFWMYLPELGPCDICQPKQVVYP